VGNRTLTAGATRAHAPAMRIGEMARELGVSADTLRFYERSGLIPVPPRAENGYRDYGPVQVERIRLLLDLRRLDLPLNDAAKLAGWCQTGHCDETTADLTAAIASKRRDLRERMVGLSQLDDRLAGLERHLGLAQLQMAPSPGACCAAAEVVLTMDGATMGQPQA
jgi:DNA-binding transcriptional MerR regulator